MTTLNAPSPTRIAGAASHPDNRGLQAFGGSIQGLASPIGSDGAWPTAHTELGRESESTRKALADSAAGKPFPIRLILPIVRSDNFSKSRSTRETIMHAGAEVRCLDWIPFTPSAPSAANPG